MSFLIDDGNVLDKYNNIWDKTKNSLSINIHTKPVYDETYIKVKCSNNNLFIHCLKIFRNF